VSDVSSRVSGTAPGQRRLNGPQTSGRECRNLSEPTHAGDEGLTRVRHDGPRQGTRPKAQTRPSPTRPTRKFRVSSPQLLVLRWLPPGEPAEPVAYALTQLGPLNTELSAAGGSAFQAFVPLTSGLLHMPSVLRGWPLTRLSEHDGLLICAIRSDARCAGVIVTIAPKQPSATFRDDRLILSDLHSHRALIGQNGVRSEFPAWLQGSPSRGDRGRRNRQDLSCTAGARQRSPSRRS
jgi:hypothetical protein